MAELPDLVAQLRAAADREERLYPTATTRVIANARLMRAAAEVIKGGLSDPVELARDLTDDVLHDAARAWNTEYRAGEGVVAANAAMRRVLCIARTSLTTPPSRTDTPTDLPALVARLRALAEKATQGQREVAGRQTLYERIAVLLLDRDCELIICEMGDLSDARPNAEFIAACDPQTILALCDALTPVAPPPKAETSPSVCPHCADPECVCSHWWGESCRCDGGRLMPPPNPTSGLRGTRG